MPALATYELTKDYAVGFWRKRPVPCARSPDARGRSRRGLRLSRPERRRQDHDAEAADAAGVPDVGPRRDPRPAGSAISSSSAASATCPRTRTSTTTSPPRSCWRISPALFGYRRRRTRRARVARCSTRSASAPSGGCSCASSRRACCSASASRRRSSTIRAGHFRRADVGPRSARPPRRARADPAAARSRLHGVLQLARAERRGSALQPRRHSRERAAGDGGRLTEMLAFQVRGWELVAWPVTDRARGARSRATRVRIGDDRYVFDLPVSPRPTAFVADLSPPARRCCRSIRCATPSRTCS